MRFFYVYHIIDLTNISNLDYLVSMNWLYTLLLLTSFNLACDQKQDPPQLIAFNSADTGRITPAAERPDLYLPRLIGKKVAVVVNQTSRVKDKHLVDMLLDKGVAITKIFSPEHGFRGVADAGQKVANQVDSQTGLPIISLYGKNKKPSQQDLSGVDILVFDIQDVGVRFYTYISTLHYVMEAAAESNIPVIVLDRPNPLGSFIDGPVLEEAFKSFVGMHPVPVVYGMTIGEYALMINGEKWLADGIKSDLQVIPLNNYTHSAQYILPVKPSPNLPNNMAIGHYPSLCFFEGTTVSVGRGTNKQFQVIGHPAYTGSDFSFTPVPMPGAKYPKSENLLCKGLDLSKVKPHRTRLDLSYLIDFYTNLKSQNVTFFNDDNFFNLLAGTDQLKAQIIAGIQEEEIRAGWAAGLLDFKMMRKNYLLYK
jgi:uncharacterized protein YbbC (DUF1343 family)